MVEGPTSDDDWVVIFHVIKRVWPEAVLHRVESGEAFVYRDQEAFEHSVPDDEVPGGFLHVLVAKDSLTVAVDAEDSESSRLGHSVVKAVRSSRG